VGILLLSADVASQPGDSPPPPRPGPAPAQSRHELPVLAPYRLDLTVSALRRLSTNVVDVLTPDGEYVRAVGTPHHPLVIRVRQERADSIAVTIAGTASEHSQLLTLVRRMLGIDRDLAHFDHAAARMKWLRPLALHLRGLKPPRYPTLWEAFVNAIAFQQVSLQAASAIVRRLIMALGQPIASQGAALYLFPSAEQVLGAEDDLLRATGLSARKLATLRRAGDALASGTLDEAMLQERPSTDAAALLQQIKGIGPWTATVILLRGLGRLDVFPMNDTSVVRNLALVAGSTPLDVQRILAALGPQRGMLYYHLLLARLEARGELEHAPIP
jgi:DNA-3-methyladenine glycosylase II